MGAAGGLGPPGGMGAAGGLGAGGSGGIPSVDLDAGLVGHYTLDEATGLVAYDSATTDGAQDGKLVGGPVWGAGKLLSGLAFDGVDDYVELGDSGFVGNKPSFTIALWFATALSTDYRTLYIERNGGAGSARVNVQLWNGGVAVEMGDDADQYVYVDGPVTAADNVWHHIALVESSTASRILYFDGVAVGTETTALGTLTLTARRLGGKTNDTRYFPGTIDEVRIYDRALSPAEIEALFNPG